MGFLVTVVVGDFVDRLKCLNVNMSTWVGLVASSPPHAVARGPPFLAVNQLWQPRHGPGPSLCHDVNARPISFSLSTVTHGSHALRCCEAWQAHGDHALQVRSGAESTDVDEADSDDDSESTSDAEEKSKRKKKSTKKSKKDKTNQEEELVSKLESIGYFVLPPKAKLYCEICEKEGHTTSTCWYNPMNRERPNAEKGRGEPAANQEQQESEPVIIQQTDEQDVHQEG
ncbi:hypothetical protein L7F22_014027, partial [Adiantum nelumboides]|nr:hypothetical protein [Adiantum nelumboides]